MNTLYLVIPCYNEEEVLPETARRLEEKMTTLMEQGAISRQSRIVLVNDGSKDKTWQMISDLHRDNPLFSGVGLSRNKGHQNALLAGLLTVREQADMTISLDADLQDDLDAIDKMVAKYHEGCDVVYGVRSNRDTDTGFKRFTAEAYYKLIAAFGGEVVFNHADYRLLSRRALDALAEYQESALFLRGIVPMLGYKTDTVEYARGERFAGESKYPLKKMLALAIDGITSLSLKPLRILISLGVLLLIFTGGIALGGVVSLIVGGAWSSTTTILIAIFAVGGLNLLGLGIVGEYAGKAYMESKRRPRFFVDRVLHNSGDE
ncbi:MAG: glycosyltransferase family 2 protein [Oscillospiraceae bacterium]|nr:glycosyltransferase family 2 protein [Oscillospiraceae bacterium]